MSPVWTPLEPRPAGAVSAELFEYTRHYAAIFPHGTPTVNKGDSNDTECMLDKPALLLRAEGFAILTVSFAAYHELNGNWLVFFLVLLWPDLFMLGYLINVRLGASLYNLVHTEVFPLLLGAVAYFEHWHNAILFAIIWLAHLGMDRVLGYGLKYPTTFKDTHLQRT